MFKNKKGFSLVEVLVAMAILVAASAILVPSFLVINKDSKSAKDEIKFDSINIAFERILSEQEVLTSLEKSNYIDTKEPNDNNIIYICFEVQEKGQINFEEGMLFYKNGAIKDASFISSKIWLNTYQSLEKTYEAEHKDSFGKYLLFTISPKTDSSVAESTYQIIDESELPQKLKGKV